MSDTLGMPYTKLFDPKHGSPLYAGVEVKAKVSAAAKARAPKVKAGSCADLLKNAVWVDPGDFYEEGSELTDPVQGAVGDCYLIAALSSVAWARPYVIAHRNRATGPGQQEFMDMVEFYKGTKPQKVEVTERMPMLAPGNKFIFARSSDVGEIWPAVYEKAYAKWKTNDAGDRPNICKIAGGDPVRALSELTGLPRHYIWNSTLSAHAIWQKVRSNCISMKTFNPMVAWTHPSAPPGVNYASAHIAANHAYSILGWQYANSQEYLVLRNPWGTYEATLNVNGGTWIAWDQPCYGSGTGWWRPISLATNDGIFALRSDTFKKCFAGFGWVTTPEAP
jgi:hypothetical protein